MWRRPSCLRLSFWIEPVFWHHSKLLNFNSINFSFNQIIKFNFNSFNFTLNFKFDSNFAFACLAVCTMADMPTIDGEMIKAAVEELDEANEDSFEVRYMTGHLLDSHYDLQDGLHDVNLKHFETCKVFFIYHLNVVGKPFF